MEECRIVLSPSRQGSGEAHILLVWIVKTSIGSVGEWPSYPLLYGAEVSLVFSISTS